MAVYILDAESLALGYDEYRRDLQTLVECQESHRYASGTIWDDDDNEIDGFA